MIAFIVKTKDANIVAMRRYQAIMLLTLRSGFKMTKEITKQTLLADLDKRYKADSEKLAKLSEKLVSMRDLDKELKALEVRDEKLYSMAAALIDKKWVGNWETSDNWFHGRLPSKVLVFCEKQGIDLNEVKEALTIISSRNEQDIKQSSEYLKIEKERRDIGALVMSDKFSSLDNLIGQIKEVKESISWIEQRKRNLSTNLATLREALRWQREEIIRKKQEIKHKSDIERYIELFTEAK